MSHTHTAECIGVTILGAHDGPLYYSCADGIARPREFDDERLTARAKAFADVANGGGRG